MILEQTAKSIPAPDTDPCLLRVDTPTEVSSETEGGRRGSPRPETVARYREALALYASGGMTAARICKQCGVPETGFRSYLHKYHRDLLLARHGISAPTIPDAAHMRLRGRRGQTPAARAKYRDAIAACDSMDYLEYNVSQIARCFGVTPTGLANQLRAHYPDILERREAERRRRGLADNQQRGVRPWCYERYAGAVELLRTKELTLSEVAERCGVSVGGLRQHVLFYHKDLVEQRSDLRECGKSNKRKGHVTGTGRRHEPMPESRERYREAVQLYIDELPANLAPGGALRPTGCGVPEGCEPLRDQTVQKAHGGQIRCGYRAAARGTKPPHDGGRLGVRPAPGGLPAVSEGA